MGRRRATATILAAASIVLTACSPSNGVSSDQARRSDERAPASSTPTESEPRPSTPAGTTQVPDATGLPSLTMTDPDTIEGVLDNGLRYLVRANDNPGAKVEMRLVVDVGSGLEDESQVGGAHFLEHMLFNGTEQFPKNELIDVLRSFGAAFGADINASTSYDETVYQLTMPDDHDVVDTGIDVLRQWLSFATIDPDDVDAERGIVLDEWRSRQQTADGRVFDEVADFFLAGTAYDGHSPIGGRDAIETITADDLRRFYDDWYRPDNAAVIVVGDIDPARIVDEITSRFEDATSRGATPDRDDPAVDRGVDPSTDTQVRIVGDPDLAEGFAFVTLPTPFETTGSVEADAQVDILQELAFDIIATRLDNDALRDDAPYERAMVDSSAFVRDLLAPEISVTVDGDGVEGSVQAILDEYARVDRFGFTQAELDRAIGSRRSSATQSFDGRFSRQDSSFADEYVRHVLEDEWYVTAEREFEFVTDVLDRATVGSVAHVFTEQYAQAGAHVFVALPDDEVDEAPTADELTSTVDSTADRELTQREPDTAIGDELMERPEPVAEIDSYRLIENASVDALDPVVLEFDNGVRVALNTTKIVESTVFIEARSPGGLVVVADDDVADAQALQAVVADSGVADFDRVSLERFLDDKEVSVVPFVDRFTDGMSGTSSTVDLETMFQLTNRLMVAPRADQSAVDRYVDDQLPFAEDPSIDSNYAEFDALASARYDDPRFLLPTPETLATVDTDGIERVAADRFGDAGDWTFSLSGDFDLDEAIELSRSYFGTLPGTDRVEDPALVTSDPPSDVVVVDAVAGQGETANVSFLFSSSATSTRTDDITASIVSEIVSNRLTDVIREELGDSYSPFAQVQLGPGRAPETEVYISVSTSPELVDDVSTAVLGQLDSLRADGPSERELSNAVATVREQLDFINNGQINDEVLSALVDPEGNPTFADFVDQPLLVDQIAPESIEDATETWIPQDRYIEVRVRPRP